MTPPPPVSVGRTGILVLLIPFGVAVTAGMALSGLSMLDYALNGPRCHAQAAPSTQQVQARSIAVGTELFRIDRGRCPTGVDELVSRGYVDRTAMTGVGRAGIQFRCRASGGGVGGIGAANLGDEVELHVGLPGEDGLYGTADDIAIDR